MDLLGWSIVGSVISGAATIGFYQANARFRAAVDEAVAPWTVPERLLRRYDAQYLIDFRAIALARLTASGKPALDVYRSRVLPIDLGFAIALGLFGLFGWLLAIHFAASTLMLAVGLFGGFASCVYAVCDLGEDILLRRLLDPEGSVAEQAAQKAATLTRMKLIFITLSVIGALTFLMLMLVSRMAKPVKRS